MRILDNKSILFIAPSFFGYEIAIKNQLIEMGAKVDYFDERPVNTFWCKALVRLNRNFISLYISKYYNSVYQTISASVYDYVLVVAIEAMPTSFLEKVREINPHAVFILYMWDSVLNRKNIVNYFSYFDRVFSFDKSDCEKYSIMSFRPLFFGNEYNDIVHSVYKYDFSFIGTAHSDRYAFIRKIQAQIQHLNLKSYWYLYLQGRRLFYWNKLTNSAFKKANINDFRYKAISRERVCEIIGASRCVIDIQHPKQTGLTMRTIELLGARRKLVTTNTSIRNYDFYSDDNILIIDRDHPVIDKEFLYKSYKPLEEAIYYKYSLDGWLEELFR